MIEKHEPAQCADFGYQRVTVDEKTERVRAVFSSVASKYDLMNALMSLGMHHFWKRQAVHIANVRPDSQILDLACGTGDMAILMTNKLRDRGHITLCDINADMLAQSRDRCTDNGVISGVNFVQGNAESLPFTENSFDLITIAFGLRNVTDKNRALISMYEKLKFGGQLLILEFSRVVLPILSQLYDRYSFGVIPWLGKTIVGDESSYRYLVESIRMHPDQSALSAMLESAGYDGVDYINLSAGIVAIHRGYKL